MSSSLTLAVLQQAADRYLQAKEDVAAGWHSPCQCSTPNSRQCQQCPYFKGFIQRLQQRIVSLQHLDNHSFPLCPVTPSKSPYSDEIQQQVIWLYKQSFTLLEIQRLTGVTSKKTLRIWLYDAGLLRKQSGYSKEEQENALVLYETGLTPQQVEEKTGISADAVAKWASDKGISRAKVSYSSEQRQRSLELYQQGKSLAEITAETQVYGPTVRAWAKAKGICPRRKRGRPKVHSDQIQQHCLEQILKNGKTVVQIELETGISCSTLRNWVNNAQQGAL